MASSLGTLTLDLVARTAGFAQGMDKAQRASAKWRKTVQRDIQKVGKAFGTFAKVGTAAAVAGISVVVKRSSEAIDAQAKLAQQLNTTSSSLAALDRAGQLSGVSMQQIGVAARTLDVNIGKAAQGVGAQADALERLGLTADELTGIPLDQKILKINQAILANVPVTERAAVAADLFGSRNAAALKLLNPDVINQATKETQLFGLALSDVDAAKVELANDALSTIGVAAQGAGQQLTVALAPALMAVGNLFIATAEEAGGMGNLATNAAERVVRGMAFVANAVDGVKRVFQLAGRGIATSVLLWKKVALQAALAVVEAYNSLPFTDRTEEVANLAAAVEETTRAIQFAREDIEATLMRPLAGNVFVAEFEKAKVAAQKAAEATVESRRVLSMPPTNMPAAPKAATPEEADFWASEQETFDVVLKKREDQFKRHKEHMVAIEEATNGQLSSAARDLFGEQSGIYQALFAVEKAAAIARSIIAIQTGIAQAAAQPFPANLAAMASVASATAGLVSTIASTTIQGQAHDGLMSVPKTGTYLLEKGERVTTQDTSAKMDAMIDEARTGGVGGNVRIVNAIDPAMLTDFMGSAAGERVIMNVIQRNQRQMRSVLA